MKRIAPLLIGLATASIAQAATFNASNPTELRAAMKLAKGGDTILVQRGDYGDFSFHNYKIAGPNPVIIRAASDKDRPRFGNVNLSGTTNLIVSGFDFRSPVNPVVQLNGVDNVTFMNARITGANANSDAWDDNNSAIFVRNSTRLKILNNDFSDLRRCIYVQRSTFIVIRHNSCHHVREGLNIAAIKNADISHNLFHTFQPNYSLGEHNDAIQFWTTGETEGSSDVLFRNNYLAMGNNGAVQGFFIRSEVAENKSRPDAVHRNFTLEGNVYYGSAQHGITLSSVHGARVFNNVVVASPWADKNDSRYDSPDWREGGAMQPLIGLSGAVNHDIVTYNNITMAGVGTSPNNSRSYNNVDLYDTHRKAGLPWESVFGKRPTGAFPPVSAFRTLPNSPTAIAGIGLLGSIRAGTVSVSSASAAAFAQATAHPKALPR